MAFTSPRAARAFAARVAALAVTGAGTEVWAAGAGTARRWATRSDRSARPDGTRRSASAAPPRALAAALLAADLRGPVLFPCGDLRRDELPARLRDEGIVVRRWSATGRCWRARSRPGARRERAQGADRGEPERRRPPRPRLSPRRPSGAARRGPDDRGGGSGLGLAACRRSAPRPTAEALASAVRAIAPAVTAQSMNDLFLRACRREPVERPPVWMMRQAGRYLPEYRAVRERADFLTMVGTPELAVEVTLQPVDLLGVDAAIIFSDILVVPQAMGMELSVEEGIGPRFHQPLRPPADFDRLRDRRRTRIWATCSTRSGWPGRSWRGGCRSSGSPGAPWTLMSYMVEGQGSKSFAHAKRLLVRGPGTGTRAARAAGAGRRRVPGGAGARPARRRFSCSTRGPARSARATSGSSRCPIWRRRCGSRARRACRSSRSRRARGGRWRRSPRPPAPT